MLAASRRGGKIEFMLDSREERGWKFESQLDSREWERVPPQFKRPLAVTYFLSTPKSWNYFGRRLYYNALATMLWPHSILTPCFSYFMNKVIKTMTMARESQEQVWNVSEVWHNII